MKNVLIIIVLLSCIGNAVAQNQGRSHKDLVNLNQWRSGGWHFAPGLTYMVPFKPKKNTPPVVDPKGVLAVYLEFGRWKMFPGGGNIFNYYDYSLAYKRLSGKEEYFGIKGQFKQNHAVGNFNINNIIQLNDYMFIQNSLGVNLDYKFSEKYESSLSPYFDNTNKLLLSLHYKLGFGYKVTKKVFVIPTLETPILNGLEWENARSDYGIFSSRYRPVIFTLRIAWLLKPKKGDCPPVYDGANGKDKKNFDDLLQQE